MHYKESKTLLDTEYSGTTKCNNQNVKAAVIVPAPLNHTCERPRAIRDHVLGVDEVLGKHDVLAVRAHARLPCGVRARSTRLKCPEGGSPGF